MGKNKNGQDWANLNRYAIENQKIMSLPNNKDQIVFMGDSIIEGWLRIHPDFFYGKPYINRGIGGQTTPQMLLRFRADVINHHPKTVLILAGINDIAGNTGTSSLEMILNNIMSMTELAKANTIKIILCTVLPASNFYWRPEVKPNDRIIALNEMLKTYAQSNKIPFVDFYTLMKDSENGLKKEYSPDGVHPNLEGYKVMEEILEDVLK